MKKTILFTVVAGTLIALASCYKNYNDISSNTLSSINCASFRNDVVPIVVGGACGCHNNGSNRQVAFSHGDTVFYSAILTRAAILRDMANGGAHPGEGSVVFSPSQDSIIRSWYKCGAKDDGGSTVITGTITYANNIVPIYKTDCKGGSCHGGSGPTLDYDILKSSGDVLQKMMNSAGASGHPGGTISIAGSSAATFLAWINQGYLP
jgi:hypothetical protein